MKTVLLSLIALVLTTAQSTVGVGDVFFVDPATEQPYMWLHPDGHMELLAPYQPEQAYKLLLAREQAAWDAFYTYGAATKMLPWEAPKPKRTIAR